MPAVNDYRNLIVWQKAMEVAELAHGLASDLPKNSWAMMDQIRRSAISIPSNIAEGRMRNGDVEFRRFLIIAMSSGAELETQYELVSRLHPSISARHASMGATLNEVMKLLNVLIRKLGANP
jgi:four helix bundle protein